METPCLFSFRMLHAVKILYFTSILCYDFNENDLLKYMSNIFEFNSAATNNDTREVPPVEHKSEQTAKKTKPLDLKFFVTDHSADNADTGNPEKLKELYEDIKKDGITSVRYDWRWNNIEPQKGECNDELLDRYGQAVEIMHEAGLESPTVIFSSIPDWALKLYKEDKEVFFDAYRNYVKEVASGLSRIREKTGEDITRFQILNELNNLVYTPIDSHDLPQLCAITREELREYNPDIKLVASIFAGNLPKVIERVTLGKVKMGIYIEEYLRDYKDALGDFDVYSIDYYPGMWHIPATEARENKKEIFKQLGLLQSTMTEIASWNKEYELDEVGMQTNIPLMSDAHNQDRQRYFYDVFFRTFKQMLLDIQRKVISLQTRVGLYEAIDEPPKNVTGKILRKITPFPEHDMCLRKGDMSRKEILQGNRHIPAEEDRGQSQLHKIIEYMNSPVKKTDIDKNI